MKKTLTVVQVYKISIRYPEKLPSCDILRPKIDTSIAISWYFCILMIFKSCPIRAIQKVFRVILSVLDVKFA